MPYIYKDVQRTMREVTGVECSKCKQFIDAEDVMEFQEIMSCRTISGFGSVWGDGATVEVDLCQHCAYHLFKDFATVHESDY